MTEIHCELFPACFETGRDGRIPDCNKERCPGTANKSWADVLPEIGAAMGHLSGPLKSTKAMRDRCRELSSPHRDDYDRAVVCIIDDLEALLSRR